MNIEPLWTLVDQHRKMADGLEHQIRVISGDVPDTMPQGDRIEAYVVIVRCLIEAAGVLNEFADSEGRRIGYQRANKARVAARRCTAAVENLAKAGEL